MSTAPELTGPYWEVHKAIAILAFFGGLRLSELMELELEKFSITPKGIVMTHKRSKQRSDKRETRFLVPKNKEPNSFDFAEFIANYISNLKEDIGTYTGRAFWTGRADHYVNIPMGRNMVADIPHVIATYLELPNAHEFTFHSFRRSSATAAADAGATPAQMVDFFGWKNTNMPNQYISSSSAQVNTMANRLANTNNGCQEAEGQNNGCQEAEGQQEDPLAKEDTNNPGLNGKVAGQEPCSQEAKGDVNNTSTSSEDEPQMKKRKVIIIKNVNTIKM